VDVVATERSRFVAGPNVLAAATDWLKFEATFASFRGDLDGWMSALPARLDDMRRGYDPPS
jgi:hypothetical protein